MKVHENVRHILGYIPAAIRIHLYHSLRYMSSFFFKRQHAVQRLPFNLFLKSGHRGSSQNEVMSLILVAMHTSIPSPKVLDYVSTNSGESYLLMTGVPGEQVGRLFDDMTPEQHQQFIFDLQNCIKELRQITNPHNFLICNALGGACNDIRLLCGGNPGPFSSEAAFNDFLLDISQVSHRTEGFADVISRLRSTKHMVYFTHADLGPTNILVNNGRLSGIVDWEMAGWYPEYWELSKSLYFSYSWTLWRKTIMAVLPGYDEELNDEIRLRNRLGMC